MTLVGDHRQELVRELDRAYNTVARDSSPALVSLEASPGWGKTRIVQAFYELLAARQSPPHYWPSGLVDPRETDPLRLRKHIVPQTCSRGAPLPWMWWGLSCGRSLDGLSEHVLARDLHQVQVHLELELRRAEVREDYKHVMGSLADLAIGLAPVVGTVVSAHGVVESRRRLRPQRVPCGSRVLSWRPV